MNRVLPSFIVNVSKHVSRIKEKVFRTYADEVATLSLKKKKHFTTTYSVCFLSHNVEVLCYYVPFTEFLITVRDRSLLSSN